MSKETSYLKSGPPEDNEVEDLVSRLNSDLRQAIRRIDLHEVLSPRWLEMTETFGRIASISEVESKLAAPKDQKGTLWETEEQALRHILEDGKLGICFRCLVEFKRYQRTFQQQGSNTAAPLLSVECDKFEKCLGTILLNTWAHAEALQMMDLTTVVHYIADVLERGQESGFSEVDTLAQSGQLHLKQEGMVIAYVGLIARHLDSMSEDRVMPVVRARGVFLLAASILERTHKVLPQEPLIRYVEALSLIAETEDFKTYRDSYVQPVNLELFLNLKSSCLLPLQTSGGGGSSAQRQIVRPLIDSIDRLKRSMSTKK
jgi:hypothetical protein